MGYIVFSISFILVGTVISLTGFKVIRPFPNDPKKRQNYEKNPILYQFGGLLLIAYGIFKLIY